MGNLQIILKSKKILIVLICIIILIGGGVYLYCSENNFNKVDSIDILEKAEEDMANENIDNKVNQDENNAWENLVIEETEKIVIHITGEVKKKGILYLNKGARIVDAIAEAGGETKDADLDKVNLAYELEDGQKVYIPNKKEEIEEKGYIILNGGNNVLVEEGKNDLKNQKGANEKVNINSANQTELETLPGIGPSLAQRIIEYRELNGKFEKVEDVQNVKGIGDAKYSNIKEQICI